MVFNRKWKYDTCVEQGSRQFMDISSDSSSNVYVTDYVNASILVFNKELSFVRSFGSCGRRRRELIKPYGLCVSDSYICISNWGTSHNVTVFFMVNLSHPLVAVVVKMATLILHVECVWIKMVL